MARRLPVWLALALLVQTVSGLQFFRVQRDFYRQPPGVFHAIRWLRAQAGAVAVSPGREGWPVGWWVEGLTGRPALVGSALQWLNFPEERQRARQANAIFSRFPSEAGMALARALGVRYLLVPKSWPGFDRSKVQALLQATPRALAFENEAALVLQVPPGPGPTGPP